MIISVGYRVKSQRGVQFKIWATSVDYNPHSEASIRFFKIVQNKLHYAVHGHTAAEVIYERANAEKPFMGLTSFSGELPALKDIGIAKNYLQESELKILNNLVSGYFDLAEINAIEHKPMWYIISMLILMKMVTFIQMYRKYIQMAIRLVTIRLLNGRAICQMPEYIGIMFILM